MTPPVFFHQDQAIPVAALNQKRIHQLRELRHRRWECLYSSPLYCRMIGIKKKRSLY